MVYLKTECQMDSIFPLKENRKVALSQKDKQQGRYVSLRSLLLEENTVVEIWLEGVDLPLLLSKQVFTNKDGSQGLLYLVTSDLNLSASQMQAICQKRWKVEVYHKSLKSNASFCKSPTRTIRNGNVPGGECRASGAAPRSAVERGVRRQTAICSNDADAVRHIPSAHHAVSS